MLYCPRCDKRIEPEHRCLSRRIFLGALLGASAAVVVPKPVVAAPPTVTVACATIRGYKFAMSRALWSVTEMPGGKFIDGGPTPSSWQNADEGDQFEMEFMRNVVDEQEQH